ncbi:MAG: acyl carrier protein [Christensenellales bacterium]
MCIISDLLIYWNKRNIVKNNGKEQGENVWYTISKTMIADQLGVKEDEVKPETRLKEDLKADSASVMMIVMDIECEFEIEVEDDAIEKVKTVADMVKYIEEKM